MIEGVPDRWMVLRVPRPQDESRRDLMVEVLLECGARGVEERDDLLVIYLPPPSEDPQAFVRRVTRELERVSGSHEIAVELDWQPHEAWEERWRTHFKPRRITERITVAPSWERPEVPPGTLLLTLDPGIAFGTSDHPTTRGCIRMLDGRVRPGDRVADVGAGSGILAITAALLGAADVLAIELDPWACQAARENLLLNGVEERVRVRAAPITSKGLPGEPPFDGIVANIESSILTPLLPGLRSALEDGGWLILSGILRTESEASVVAAAAADLGLDGVDEEGDWWTGAFVTPD
ncbi:MAG: 50S ribosomal protein L11 methyltransferase [Gemmatimonadales bacterium]|nr:MAG: 50S ribosomal protein L11 methyltransferase [Gemmatimonadales bacterium]